jgi:hypothetical protein
LFGAIIDTEIAMIATVPGMGLTEQLSVALGDLLGYTGGNWVVRTQSISQR